MKSNVSPGVGAPNSRLIQRVNMGLPTILLGLKTRTPIIRVRECELKKHVDPQIAIGVAIIGAFKGDALSFL
jgi:hypothetical protein